MIAAGGKSVEGLIVIGPCDTAPEPLQVLYREKYHEEVTFVTLRQYDAILILGAAARKCRAEGFQTACLIKEIQSVHDFPGSSYPINFDANGDINEHYCAKTVKDGHFVSLGMGSPAPVPE